MNSLNSSTTIRSIGIAIDIRKAERPMDEDLKSMFSDQNEIDVFEKKMQSLRVCWPTPEIIFGVGKGSNGLPCIYFYDCTKSLRSQDVPKTWKGVPVEYVHSSVFKSGGQVEAAPTGVVP